jgi:integrase
MSATRSATRKKPRRGYDFDKPASEREFVADPVLALREMEQWGHWRDDQLKGLFIHIGRNKCVWRYMRQRQINGKRAAAFKTLGYWPEMNVKEAREAGLIFAGSVAAGVAAPGKRVALKFGPAFESYLTHLKDQAEAKGKEPRWYYNARKLYEKHLKEWSDWSLYDLSQNPRVVAAWHSKLAKRTPPTADHCARLMRACYRREARLDRSLNAAALPISGVEFGKVGVSDKVLDFPDFPAWRKCWDKIENQTHRGYHLAGLLTGCRPGELARLRTGDVDREAMTLTLRKAKAGKDIVLPITDQIIYALNLAACAPKTYILQKGLKGMKRGEVRWVEMSRPDLAFPGCRQIGHRSRLPVSGNALRHTFRSVAVSLGVPEMLIHFLMGHALQGVSAKYTNEWMVLRSAELRDAQERISRRIFQLLGLTLGTPQDALLLPHGPTQIASAA